jgi:hypothetical protein
VGITATLDRLVSAGRAKPAVLVMPDANGAPRISLQCLNQAGGPQDLTYLARELPLAMPHRHHKRHHRRARRPALAAQQVAAQHSS